MSRGTATDPKTLAALLDLVAMKTAAERPEVCGECGVEIWLDRGRWTAPDQPGVRRFTCGPFVAHRPVLAS